MISYSPLTYHIAAAAGRGSEPGCTPNIHIGAAEYAGEDHKVRFQSTCHERSEWEATGHMLTIPSFMAHPETLLPMPKIDDPVQRFVSVVKFYLSGWHIKPP